MILDKGYKWLVDKLFCVVDYLPKSQLCSNIENGTVIFRFPLTCAACANEGKPHDQEYSQNATMIM